MQWVVFGGSFDPIHRGHVAMADAVQSALQPQELLWLPSHHAPHKAERPPQAGDLRLELIEAVVADRPGESVSRLEIERGGLSFTVDTLRTLEAQFGVQKPGLLLGADSLDHLLTWRDPMELFQRVQFLFVPRPGWGEADLERFRRELSRDLQPAFHARFLDMEEGGVDSTSIRRDLARGVMPAGLPPQVAKLIAERGAYGFSAS